jgi:tRNA G46 methylase TrmB
MSDSQANLSAPVRSVQLEPHPQLEKVVRRHCLHDWRVRPHQPTVAAFDHLQALLDGRPRRPIVLDSGCGTGKSTLRIGTVYPESWVIGIDQSSKRLEKTGSTQFPHKQGNVIWIRAELASFWWLAHQAGWQLAGHYILYPNPWPKPAQLRRRWHGHPVFPTLLSLGGQLEMRTNWGIYAQEFAAAIEIAADVSVHMDVPGTGVLTTPFERKYRHSGLPLYRVRAWLSPRS